MSVFDNVYEESNNNADTDFSIERPRRRTPRESEDDLTAAFVSDGYRTQISTKKNENGEIIEVAYGTKGSRRPDAINMDDDHVKIVEVKNYGVIEASGKNNLVNNIRRQTDKSLSEYGDDVEITEVVDVRGQNVTIEDMEELTKKIEEKVPEVGLDYRW